MFCVNAKFTSIQLPPNMRISLLCFCLLGLFITSAYADSVSGTITYPGIQEGPIKITGKHLAAAGSGNLALDLDGAGDFVIVPSITDLSGSAITVSYWYKGPTAHSVVRQQGAGFMVVGWNDQHILSNDGGVGGISIGGTAEDGNWHHLLMSWQQNTENGFASYLDGELVESRNSADAPIPNMDAALYFGNG